MGLELGVGRGWRWKFPSTSLHGSILPVNMDVALSSVSTLGGTIWSLHRIFLTTLIKMTQLKDFCFTVVFGYFWYSVPDSFSRAARRRHWRGGRRVSIRGNRHHLQGGLSVGGKLFHRIWAWKSELWRSGILL